MASSRGGVAALRVVVRPWLVIFLLLAGTRAALVDVSTEASEKSRSQMPRSAVNTTEGPQHSEKPLMTESVSSTSKRNDEKGTTDNFESTTTDEWPVIEMVSTDSSSTSPRNEDGNESEWPKVEDELSTSDVAPETNNTTVMSLVSSQDSVSTTKKLSISQKLALYNVPKVAKSGKNIPFRSRRHPPATRQPELVRDPSKYRYTTFLDGDYVSTSETDTSSSFSPTAPLYETTTSPQVETTESYRQESDDERSEKSEARFDVPRDELSTVLTTSESAESQEERTDLTSECSIDECGVESTSASSATTTESPATSCGDAGSTCASDGSPRNDTETTTAVAGTAEMPWPVKMAAELPGDLILGGLMMVHEREESVTCGPVMPQGGVQALEAMLFTLDVLNADPALIPNVTLGAHILDDCDKDTYGLEMAVDFIKGSISNIDDAEYHCNKTQVRKVISGVVGAASSVTSIQVANLLRLFRIPQVSFFSTSPELSNKQRFEYFSRTIPSDHYQVKAMVEIVKLMQWNYVSILYEESNYGIKAFEELETLFTKYNVCIAVKEKLVKDSGVAQDSGYDGIVYKLLTKPRARGVIIFGSDQEVAGVMRAVRRVNATGAFYWIGSDGWSARSLVSDGNEREVEGTLSVQPRANPVRGFREYFLNLTVENNRRNPWFVEFWEDHFQCRYPNSSRTPYNAKYKQLCTPSLALASNNTEFEAQLQFVSDAVMAFAHAFKDMHRELCAGRPGLCDAMKPIKGTELLKYLRKVTFEGLSGDRFHFDTNGDGPARYNIIHFRQMSRDHYQWVRVGEYTEKGLELNMSEVQFRIGQRSMPDSVCSLPCQIGQAKKYVEGESCCWHCFNCTQYQIRHPQDETQCVSCPLGQVPDENRQRCRDIPEVFLRPESGWAIGAMAFSATGALVTLFVCGVFARHHDTPVVRASGRELSYVLLTGILLCYCVTFALVLRPTDVVCGVQRFGAGFCFTVVYAALLTKTNRIARIFNAGKRTAKRPSFISPKSQLFICSALVGVQVLINGVWILVSPPRAVHHHPTREDNHLVCSSHIDASYMIAFGYPILLIIICTVYAVLTRKIPEAFNESKHIGFTMYTTCVIWLAFVPLYFGTSSHIPLRITSMSVTISLSASVTLACLFSPKLYIIIVRPERNVRQSMMPVRYSAIKSPGVTGTAQTGSMMAAVVCPEKPSLGPPSSAHSEGVDLELREDVVHQLRRPANPQPRLLVNRATQTTAESAVQQSTHSPPDLPTSSSNGPVLPTPAPCLDAQL